MTRCLPLLLLIGTFTALRSVSGRAFLQFPRSRSATIPDLMVDADGGTGGNTACGERLDNNNDTIRYNVPFDRWEIEENLNENKLSNGGRGRDSITKQYHYEFLNAGDTLFVEWNIVQDRGGSVQLYLDDTGTDTFGPGKLIYNVQIDGTGLHDRDIQIEHDALCYPGYTNGADYCTIQMVYTTDQADQYVACTDINIFPINHVGCHQNALEAFEACQDRSEDERYGTTECTEEEIDSSDSEESRLDFDNDNFFDVYDFQVFCQPGCDYNNADDKVYGCPRTQQMTTDSNVCQAAAIRANHNNGGAFTLYYVDAEITEAPGIDSASHFFFESCSNEDVNYTSEVFARYNSAFFIREFGESAPNIVDPNAAIRIGGTPSIALLVGAWLTLLFAWRD